MFALYLFQIECLLFQEAYALLSKFGVKVSKEEADRVDTFRYSFEKLLSQAVSKYSINKYFSVYVGHTRDVNLQS